MGLVREYAGKAPRLGARVYLAETAAVIGDVVLGDDVSVWYNSVVRGDCHYIRIGARSNIQDNCAIHVTQGTHPTVLEEEVTLGHGAIVHGAVVRQRSAHRDPRDGLDGAEVGESAFVGAGALVTPRTVVPARARCGSARRPGRCASCPGRRGRRPEALPPQLPGVQEGVLPPRRDVGVAPSDAPSRGQGHARPASAREREVGRRGAARAETFRSRRLRRDPHADPRGHGALCALGRRNDRHRPQGDVHASPTGRAVR